MLVMHALNLNLQKHFSQILQVGQKKPKTEVVIYLPSPILPRKDLFLKRNDLA